MKFGLLTATAVLCTFGIFAGARPGFAQEISTIEEEGWTEVQAGVLRREMGENRVQTFTFGKEGLRWTAQRLAERITALERESSTHPSEQLTRILAALKERLARTEALLQGGDDPASTTQSDGDLRSSVSQLTAGCEPTVTMGASAGPQSTQVPGVTASANISFQSPSTCPGNTYTYAYSRATTGSTMSVQSREDARNNGTSLTSALSVSASGSLDCFSEAYATAWIEDLTYEATDANYSCTAGPLDSTPYGLPFTVPGTIKAADFDNGGEGVAFHELSPDDGSSYRATEVDLYDDIVVRLVGGEWLQYTVDVQAAGAYTLVAEVGEDGAGGLFHVELDGVDVTGPVVVPPTGGWARWAAPIRSSVQFPAGRHTLRFVVDEGFAGFRSLRFVVAQGPVGGTPRTLPGTINFVEFDEGGELISYHDVTAGCRGTCERIGDVDHYEQWVYNTASGEWMEYTVNVTTAGVYTLTFRVAAEHGGGTFHLELDGVNVTGPLTLPTTGDWNTFQNVVRTGVSLPAGRHVLRLVVDTGSPDVGTFHTLTVQP